MTAAVQDKALVVASECCTEVLDQRKQSASRLRLRGEEEQNLSVETVGLCQDPVVVLLDDPLDMPVGLDIGCWPVEVEELLQNVVPHCWGTEHDIWQKRSGALKSEVDLV